MANRHSALDAINAEIEKFTKKSFAEPDARLWYPQTDKAGNGGAIFRFLPSIDLPGSDGPEQVPFVRYWLHSFQGPTGLWIVNEMCPTTKGGTCPICDYNRSLWNSGDESKKQQASRQKRKLKFMSNIYVVKDPANPENEGQVRLFLYGKKIWDKVAAFHTPAFEGQPQRNAFDLLGADSEDGGGANFIFQIHKTKDGPNYDASSFDAVASLSTDQGLLKSVRQQLHPLQPFIADSLFNDAATIKGKLDRVLGLNGVVEEAVETSLQDVIPIKPGRTRAPVEAPVIPDEEEMDEDYFKRLAQE